jgi:hypothetical protein
MIASILNMYSFIENTTLQLKKIGA